MGPLAATARARCRSTFLTACVLACRGWAFIAEHAVKSLPGWEDDLPSPQFSGLLPVANGTKQLHYWLVLSENDPASDPLLLWLNGGPGASSLLGYFTELGPLMLSDDSVLHPVDGVPSLYYNPHTWSKLGSVLFLESPAGVGFSFCEEGTDCVHTDESTAADTADFFREFYKHYPELKSNDLYITGESYAGVYLPMLAEQLLEHQPDVNLKGIAVGNGCWGTRVGICAAGTGDSMAIATGFFHAHNMFDDALWDKIQKHCDWDHPTQRCHEVVAEMHEELGSFWLYNIYDSCGGDEAAARPQRLLDWFELGESGHYQLRAHVLGRLGDYKCGSEGAMVKYLADPKVAAAIHVREGTGGMRYKLTVPDLRPLYKKLSDHVRILVYSGDVDGCVPTHGTETFFLRALGMKVTQRWAPWQCDNDDGHFGKAGYHEKFGGTKHGIDFVTVNGAGHMVPQYKPREAFTFMRRWLNGDELGERRSVAATRRETVVAQHLQVAEV